MAYKFLFGESDQMSNRDKLLSVITPTYNRAVFLEKCYRSLLGQSCKQFEWIIIDDGSTDNTETLVDQFISNSAGFEITYVKKENGGKHTALNESHTYIHGEYVLILDSDDTLTDDAVGLVLKGWERYDTNSSIGVLIFLRGKSVDDPLAYAKDENIPVDLLRYKRVCVHSSDCCEVIRTELFKKYPFPVYKNERFMSEGVLWHRVARTHKCVYINKVIYICEYQEGGLTKSGRAMRIKNPLGGMLNSELNMSRKNYFKLRVKNGMLYVCYGFFAGLKPIEILKRGNGYRLLKIMCVIPGYGLFVIWKKKYCDHI